MNKIVKTFKKILYNIIREYAKIYFTGNLGKVVEKEQELVCHVTKRKCKEGRYDCGIFFQGIRDQEERELAEKFGLDKPILYIMDGLEFKRKKVYIFGHKNCSVLIRNCKFDWDLYIGLQDKCILENTSIKSFGGLSIGGREMVLKNMTITNHLALIGKSLAIDIEGSKSLDIVDSNIGKEHENTEVALFSSKLNLVRSNIAGYRIVCKSESILSDADSSLIAEDIVRVTTDHVEQLQISSPIIAYNGTEYSNDNKLVTLEEIKDPLRIKRLELVQFLKELKIVCEEENSEKEKEVKEQIERRPVQKILRNYLH